MQLVTDELIYSIDLPNLPGGAYFFTTFSGIKYEVRFVKIESIRFTVVMAFGVVNEEYDGDEYVLTNKGEVFRVMNTVVEIAKHYIQSFPHTSRVDFFCAGSDEKKKLQRLKLYRRFLEKTVGENWNINHIQTTGISLTKMILN